MGHNRAGDNRKKRLKRRKRSDNLHEAVAFFEVLTKGRLPRGTIINRRRKRVLQGALDLRRLLQETIVKIDEEPVGVNHE